MALKHPRSFFSSRPIIPFQVLSDLHLEIERQYSSLKFPACARYLILVGDVGRLTHYDEYLGFLRKPTERFETVSLTWGLKNVKDVFKVGTEKTKFLEHEPSLRGRPILLNQRRLDIPGSDVTILGCLLWSNIPSEPKNIVGYKIQDFHQVGGWTAGTRLEFCLATLGDRVDTRQGPRRKKKMDKFDAGKVVYV